MTKLPSPTSSNLLAFITSLYGMRFMYMPELKWRFGYALIWVVILVAAMMLAYFRRRRWL